MGVRVLVSVIGIMALIGFALWIDSGKPNSTPGVTIIKDNVARLPVGEVFILTERHRKSSSTWEITFDGKSVHFVCQDWLCSDLDSATPGPNDVVVIEAGLTDEFYVSILPDGAASVKWPWGYTYRPFRS